MSPPGPALARRLVVLAVVLAVLAAWGHALRGEIRDLGRVLAGSSASAEIAGMPSAPVKVVLTRETVVEHARVAPAPAPKRPVVVPVLLVCPPAPASLPAAAPAVTARLRPIPCETERIPIGPPPAVV